MPSAPSPFSSKRRLVRVLLPALVGVILVLCPMTASSPGQTDPLDKPFAKPVYVLHVQWSHTYEYGKVKNDFYILHGVLPDAQNGMILRQGWDGQNYQSYAEFHSGPHQTPRQVCAAIAAIPAGKISDIMNRIRCPAASPPPPPAPKPAPATPTEPAVRADRGEDGTVKPTEQQEAEKPAEPEKEDAAAAPSKCTEEAHEEDVRTLHRVQDQADFAAEEYQNTKAKLGMMRLAAAKIRPKIAYFDDAVLNKNYGEKMRESLDRETEELRRELNGILQEQDVELRDMLYRYDFAIGECRELAGKTSCDDVRTTALNMEQQLRRRRDMAELELLLASSEPGERGQFHALARKFVDENKYRDYVNLLRAMDFAERRDPRSALYALRQAAQDNPDNPAVREMLKSIELGYLKAIDSKITGEAADVRARLWESLGEHGEEGFLGALKDILTTGVTGASLAIGGKYESLADLAATIGDEAQVQHSGLILIIRLREAGLALSDIRDMVIKDKLSGDVPQDFSSSVKDKFGWDLTREQALRMRFSINMAFQNRDVGRLGRDNREQFDIDVGNAYFNTEAFESEWTDWIGDVVNVKNVALMLGPSAVVASGGKLVWWSSEIVDKGVTFKDIFCNAIRLPQIVDKFAQTQAGQACIRELLKFDRSTGLVSKALAEALVQQGIIKAGEALGGRAGEFAAEVLTTLGVGDIDQTLRILEQSGIDAKTIGTLGQVLRQAAEGIEDAAGSVKVHSGKLDDALREVTERGSLTPASREALESSRKDIDDKILRLMNRTAAEADSHGAVKQLEQYMAMKAAIDDALSGNRAGARVGRKAVDQLEEQAEKSAHELTQKARTCEEIAEGLRKADAEVPGRSLSKGAGELPDGKDSKVKSLDDLVHNSGLEGPSDPKVPLSQRKIRLEADRAKGLKYFEEGPDGIRPGFRSGFEEADAAMAKKDWPEAVRKYKELYAQDLSDTVRAEARLKYEQAKAALDAEQGRSLTKNLNEDIMRKYGKEEVDNFAAGLKSGDYVLKQIDKPSAQRPYWLLDSKTGERVAIIKPSSIRDGWDIKREAISQRIMEELRGQNAIGFRSPACTKMEVEINGKSETCLVERIARGADLEDLPVGHHYTVVDQLAEERAVSAFLLDFDRHSANEKVDEGLSLIAIDRGYSGIGQIQNIGNLSDAQLEARVVRDFLSIGADKPGKDVIIKNVENLMTYNQMEGVVKSVEGWDAAKIRAMLGEIVDTDGQRLLTDAEIDDTARTLLASRRNFGKSLEAKFPRVQMGPLPDGTPRRPAALSWGNRMRDIWTGMRQPALAPAGGWA